MEASRGAEITVGIFVALGLAALFFLAMQVSNLASVRDIDGYNVTARFENIGSLKVRSPVTMAGVKIGRVVGVEFEPESFEAKVTMVIAKEYKTLPADTSASILTAGLLGEQYVGLEPGGSRDNLKDGDNLRLTQSAVVLEKLVNRFLFEKVESSTAPPAEPSGGLSLPGLN